MLKKYFSSSLFLSSFFVLDLLSGAQTIQKEPPICGDSPRPMRVTMRHIEANGVGYHEGYSTLEGFFAPTRLWKEAWIPFLDLRGHVFNNGKPAANAGLGLRYLASSRIWGINAYYDYRNTTHQHYNQISVGLESLGEIWDFRLNGYLPVGDKKSSRFGTKFDKFKGNYAILSRKYEFALKGANAEVGAHVNRFKNVPIYFAAGPYYLEGQGRVAWGGEARVAVDLFDYIRLEGSTSYDNVFKWIGQGQLSVIIPFGGKRQVKQRQGNSCSLEMALAERAVQRVDRNEIIPVDRKHKRSKAINPATGQPYFFWFVDNTSSSDGTFESPFSTLIAAQNASSIQDVIYVFPGDGTTTGMDAGIILKDHQKLFGAGTDQTLATTLGTIRIPAMASELPKIVNLTGSTVTCANDNEISGMHVFGSNQHGIDCIGIQDVLIHDNVINSFTVTPFMMGITGQPLFFNSSGGQIIVRRNQLIMDSSALTGPIFGVQIISATAGSNYLFEGNSFSSVPGSVATGFELGDGPSSLPVGNMAALTIAQNQFTGMGLPGGPAKAIGGFGFAGSSKVTINENTFSECSASAPGIVFLRIRSGANIVAEIANNIWENSSDPSVPSLYIPTQSGTSQVCVTLTGNTSDSMPTAYVLDNTGGGNFIADLGSNVGTVGTLGTVTPGSCP